MAALFPLFVISAALAVLAAPWALGLPWLAWIFKPLATIAVIAHAARRGEPGSPERRAVLAGLGLSLLGDIALLWPERGFVPGLVAFLLAHLAYLVAFTRRARFVGWPPAFIAYAVVAGGLLALLWSGVPAALRLPVVAYVVCLASMAAQAAVAWWMQRGSVNASRARLAAIGGALFVFSDAIIAIDRFAQPLPAASLWILPAYWAAQWLIASTLAPRKASLPG
ncbi:lysoplasmalogenase [Aquincola sp. S2]|uniref:Lysoplasmalogenase n=1 Tax=Pseudaquabacterium terrae TaxID=2732868 RepID=A0ABX2EM68_9BURK|nr:lysoplasmalogenase [Aquabacterium terrae]NRF69688.1 lysoplasmalogenase [Aquabacterium terrae]